MKRITALLAVLILTVLTLVLPALSDETAPFSFRNGISFGMSDEQVIQTEADSNQVDKESWMSKELNGWLVKGSKNNIRLSSYDSDIILMYFFRDQQMEVAIYDVSSQNEETFDTVTKAVSTVYGKSTSVSAEDCLQIMDAFNPGFYNESSFSSCLAWELENVTIYQFYYDSDAAGHNFVLAYLNPGYDYSSKKETAEVDITGI